MHQETIQIIFGLKVGQLRAQKGISLKSLAAATGMSVSYLNEIEKGKKFPKVEKMLLLSRALDVQYDELISPKLDGSLNPLGNILASPLIQKFPFHIFGTSARELLQLMVGHPKEMGILGSMLSELGRNYDLHMGLFFHTALRCYQMLNNNYFPHLEELALSFREDVELKPDELVTHEHMRQALIKWTGYQIIEKDPEEFPEDLRTQRYFYLPARRELWLNRRLSAAQRGFVYARELGYHLLHISDRPLTSPALKTEKFEHVFDNFRVSYFAGALLLPQQRFFLDMKRIFAMSAWEDAREALLDLPTLYGVTPETLFYRMSELVPQFFRTKKVHFTKFAMREGTQKVHLEKQLNMSRLHIPNGIGLNEHFCSRWLSVSQLHELDTFHKGGAILDAQRSKFIDYGTEFFCMTVGYRSSLRPSQLFSATIGFPVDNALKGTISYYSDPAIPFRELGQTCERCPLQEGHCEQRQVPPNIYEKRQRQKARLDAMENLLSR